MTYYAGQGRISTEPIEGGIEITDEVANWALNEMCAGKELSIVEGVLVAELPPSPSEPEPISLTVDDFRVGVQVHLDTSAQERSYDNALSLVSYTGSDNPVWAAEAVAFKSWRDAVWGYALSALSDVENGLRSPPDTVEDFIEELPAMVWPDEA